MPVPLRCWECESKSLWLEWVINQILLLSPHISIKSVLCLILSTVTNEVFKYRSLGMTAYPNLTYKTYPRPFNSTQFNLFHSFDTNVYRVHPSFLILSFYNSASIIHIQLKNIHLLSASPDKHSYDSSYLSPMYHTSMEM
jgi:hypothetical protein